MKYIKSRYEFKNDINYLNDHLFESWLNPGVDPKEVHISDTLVGRLFGFIGRKIGFGIKKKQLSTLLKQLRYLFEKGQFDSIHHKPKAQEYKIYDIIINFMNPVSLGSEFTVEEFEDHYKNTISEFESLKSSDGTISKIKEACDAFIDKISPFGDLISEYKKLDESILLLEGKEESDIINSLNDLFIEYAKVPVVKGKTDTLLNFNIGTKERYEFYKDGIRKTLNNLRRSLSNIDYKSLDNKELSESINSFIEYTAPSTESGGKMNWDNQGALKASLIKVKSGILDFQEKISNLLNRDEDELNKNATDELKKKINNIISRQEYIFVKWINNKNGKDIEVYGYSTSDWEDSGIIKDGELDNNIWIEKQKESKSDKKWLFNAVFIDKDNNVVVQNPGSGTLDIDPKNIKQIGDDIIGGVSSHSSELDKKDSKFIEAVKSKMSEIFTDDKVREYNEKRQISKDEANDLLDTIKKTVSDDDKMIDPIGVARLFNKAYRKYTTDESSLPQMSVGRAKSRYKKDYESLGDGLLRHKKLFAEWNDGVLSLLQDFKGYIPEPLVKFISSLLDDNKMFGEGAQKKLILDTFGIKNAMTGADRNNRGVPKRIDDKYSSEETEDTDVSYRKGTGNDIEINDSKIKRTSILLDVVLDNKDVTMPVYILGSKRDAKIGTMYIKFTKNGDYGFINKYKNPNMNISSGSGNNLSSDGESDVYYGIIQSEGNILPGKEYKLSNRKANSNDNMSESTIKINDIQWLLGDNDNKLARMPVISDDMKRDINMSKYDKFISFRQ